MQGLIVASNNDSWEWLDILLLKSPIGAHTPTQLLQGSWQSQTVDEVGCVGGGIGHRIIRLEGATACPSNGRAGAS